MRDLAQALVRDVIERSGNRCEYCGLSQIGQEAAFHVDHVIPRAARGPTTLENLALACVSCSLRKGARQTAKDPETGDEVPIFNPRELVWREHLKWNDNRLEGRTPVGRALVSALDMNRESILIIRTEEIERGRLPQPGAQG